MTADEPPHPDRFLPRIRAELDKLPLSEEQKEQVAPKILKDIRFLDKTERKLREDSPVFDFQRKITGVVELFAADGLTAKDYLKAALQYPTLFTMKPATIAGNVAGVVQRFAGQGLTAKDYLRAACRKPALFYQSPDTIAGNLAGVVARFSGQGLTAKDYLRAACRNPALFYHSPDTIAGNIAGVVARFAAQGMTTGDYLGAALHHPSLFTMSPATINRHIEMILGLFDEGICALPRRRSRSLSNHAVDHPHPHAPIFGFLLKNPRPFSMEDKNILLRRLHKEMTGAPSSSQNLLRSRGKTELELLRHLGHDDPARPVPKNANPVLIGLIRDGYIKTARLAD